MTPKELEEGMKESIDDYFAAILTNAFNLGYETAKSEIVHCNECKSLTHSPHKWYCPVNKRVVEREEFCCWAERKEE